MRVRCKRPRWGILHRKCSFKLLRACISATLWCTWASLYYLHILHYDWLIYLDVIYPLNIWISMSLYFQNHGSRCRILWNKLVQIVRPGDRDQETRDMTHTVTGAGHGTLVRRIIVISLTQCWPWPFLISSHSPQSAPPAPCICCTQLRVSAPT